jgi:catechol 2,3-dioxygenase-like lactoylglutathione lyase family enzyme
MTARPHLFRVAIAVTDIGRALDCWGALLGVSPVEVGPGRVYFHSDGAILVCVDPVREAHGHDEDVSDGGPSGERRTTSGLVYFAIDRVDGYAKRARRAGCTDVDGPTGRDWGERSLYATDPFGNRVCFVEGGTEFTGRAEPKRGIPK